MSLWKKTLSDTYQKKIETFTFTLTANSNVSLLFIHNKKGAYGGIL